MPIGDYQHLTSRRKSLSVLRRLVGTLDLHTHLRLNPLIKFCREYLGNRPNREVKVLEIGCGAGVNGFEIAKIANKYGKNIQYIGVDLSKKKIESAKKVSSYYSEHDFCFCAEDGLAFLEKTFREKVGLEGSVDVILLIDIIEHIKDVQRLIESSDRCLKKGGIYAVSVPTPLYPKIFGRGFHDKIGHVVDGYYLEELDKLFINGINCERLSHKYNTGLISNMGCYLYYRSRNNNKYFNLLKSFVLYPFKFLDFFNNSKVSCSLFAAYKKG